MFLKEIRKKKGLTLQELADKIGATKGNLSLVENGKIKLKLERAQKIANVLGCSVFDLNNKNFNNETKTISIKYYENILASAGCGVNNFEENYTYINIDSRLLPFKKNNNYNNISIIKVKGVSMFPTLKEDDFIFIDTSNKELINNKIYVIKENNYLKVKRVLISSPYDTQITIKSDNQNSEEYPPYKINKDNVIVVGKVIASQSVL